VIHYEESDGIAVITIDNPPVNALGPGVLDGIEAAVERPSDDESVTGLGIGSAPSGNLYYQVSNKTALRAVEAA
jgi:enoyl-CoA hydratase/carnithine racemase